jgi:PAS domain S-box-containing protein
MFEALLTGFSIQALMPHGNCLIWNKGLIWLHVLSDSLIALSYYSIPFGLAYFVCRRSDLAYRRIFLLFAAFILACGTTHAFDIWTLWHPAYALQGIVKATTATISLTTAALLWSVIPRALALPSPAQLARVNAQLSDEVEKHQQAVARLQTEAAERSRLEAQLRKNEARLQTILDTAVEGIITIDEDGVTETCNPAAARMFGYTKEELVGRNVMMLMPSPHREGHDDYLAQYRETGEKRFMGKGREVMGLRRDGSAFPAEIAVGEFEDHGRHFTGIVRDVTERRRAEQALRESEQRLELALMGADLGLWDWNIATGTAVFNERWAAMLGYALDEISPAYEEWEHRLHPDDKPQVMELLNAHLAGTTPYYEAEHRLSTKTGQWRWVLTRGKVFERDLDGTPLRAAGIHRDITAHKELEERLLQQQADLLHVHRLTTAGELAATMAHELNQPLGAIANYLGGASLRFRDVLAANPALAEMMDQTLRLSKRAAEVVGSIRDLVRKHESRREWVDLGTIIAEALSLAGAELGRGRVKQELRVQEGLPRIRGQRVQLQQLLLNLILNAVEAMGAVETRRRRLTLEAALAGDQEIVVSIADTGTGFPREMAARLFEPFVSTKAQGIGLGLSICRTIAEAHGGRIEGHSDAGRGSTFRFVLPVEEEPAERAH